MSKNIVFTNMRGLDFFPPSPAIKQIPDWYLKTPEYIDDNGRLITDPEGTSHTIKKCMPVFDAMTTGYIFYTQVDVQVTQNNGIPFYSWPSQDAISFHPVEQAPLHPARNEAPYPKWNSPYSVSTPPGYSILFVPPMHNPNGIFTILQGVVDTDTYKAPVNFPFVLNDLKWEGIIPAGTPMAQVIPFKRESWKYKIGGEKEMKEQQLSTSRLQVLFFNSYKRQFWSRKKYN
jgi:hypothetical protein